MNKREQGEREQNCKFASNTREDNEKKENTSSHLVREREESKNYSDDLRNRETEREIDHTSPSNSKDRKATRGINQPCTSGNRDVKDKTDFLSDLQTKNPSDTDLSESQRGEIKYPGSHQENYQGNTGKLFDVTKANNENVTLASPSANINTPPSSFSSTTSTYFPTKPKHKQKRSCFALNEEDEEDIDLFDSPVTQVRISDSEGEKQAVGGKAVTPQSSLLKKPLFSPSPVLGRVKLPVLSKGVDKYEALASEELDDFDFEL